MAPLATWRTVTPSATWHRYSRGHVAHRSNAPLLHTHNNNKRGGGARTAGTTTTGARQQQVSDTWQVADSFRPALEEAKNKVEESLSNIKGALVEDNTFSVSVRFLLL